MSAFPIIKGPWLQLHTRIPQLHRRHTLRDALLLCRVALLNTLFPISSMMPSNHLINIFACWKGFSLSILSWRTLKRSWIREKYPFTASTSSIAVLPGQLNTLVVSNASGPKAILSVIIFDICQSSAISSRPWPRSPS